VKDLTPLIRIEWVNIQKLATEVTENTEIFSFVGAASAANSSRSDGLFAAKAAPTFTAVQIKTTKQAFAPVPLWQTIIVSTH